MNAAIVISSHLYVCAIRYKRPPQSRHLLTIRSGNNALDVRGGGGVHREYGVLEEGTSAQNIASLHCFLHSRTRLRDPFCGEEGEARVVDSLVGGTDRMVYQVGDKTVGGVHIPLTPRLPKTHKLMA